MWPLVSQLAGYCRLLANHVVLRTIWNALVKKTSCAAFVEEEGIRTWKRNCLETKPELIHYFHICQKFALVWPWCRRNLSGLLTWRFCINLEISQPWKEFLCLAPRGPVCAAGLSTGRGLFPDSASRRRGRISGELLHKQNFTEWTGDLFHSDIWSYWYLTRNHEAYETIFRPFFDILKDQNEKLVTECTVTPSLPLAAKTEA